MHLGYYNEAGELVVEFAVPGKTPDDIDITALEDDSVVIVAKADASQPNSMRGREFQYRVAKVPPTHSIENVRTQCRDGLLVIVFPVDPNYRKPTIAPLNRNLLTALAKTYRLN